VSVQSTRNRAAAAALQHIQRAMCIVRFRAGESEGAARVADLTCALADICPPASRHASANQPMRQSMQLATSRHALPSPA